MKIQLFTHFLTFTCPCQIRILFQIKLLVNMSGKTNPRILAQYQSKITEGLRCLQTKVSFEQNLTASQKCPCSVCHIQIIKTSGKNYQIQNYQQQTGKNFLKILNGLCITGVPGLKMFFPDICFIDGEMISTFTTENRENRFVKLSGATPIKSIYQTMLRLKANYKGMLEENFQKNLIDKIDPQFMHEKYLNQLLPTHFHDGFDSEKLRENKNKFKDYILHKNVNYTIPGIEEHKINENQPFCVVNYNDGNSQLYSQREFASLVALRIPSDAVYVKSFVKQKKQTKNLFTTQYLQFSSEINQELFLKAQIEVMVLIGGMNKYNQNYKDLEQLEDNSIELMKIYPEQYVLYSTYRIVHYLAMVSRIYLKHIKINWVLNDMGALYVQNIFEVETSEVSERHIKFRLPPKGEYIHFYKDSQRFLNLYSEMQIYTESKRLRIREELIKEQKMRQKENKQRQASKASIFQKLSSKSTIDKTTIQFSKNRRLKPISNSLSKTLDVDYEVSSHRKFRMKSSEKSKIEPRYQKLSIGKSMPLRDKKHFKWNSVAEKYNFDH